VLFVLLLGSLHLLEPEFNPSWRFLSEYELGNFGWMMRLAFLALATSLASAGLAISSQARTAVGYIGVTGLGIAAVGLVIAAVFRTDPATTSREAATFSGKMHVFGASLDYTPVAALLVSFSLARNMAWRPIRKWLYISVGITWVAVTAFMATLPYDRTGPFSGLVRALAPIIVSYLGWLITVGAYAMKLQKQTGVH
jgi:hypothetical protein